MKAKKTQDPVEELFRHSGTATKELHKAAKKRLREKQRADWWSQNGSKKGSR